jgi:glycosyltransferase involved in cell wall biosynthesis
VNYLPGCTRNEALTYIAESFFVFTPMQTGYGGLIGDAWSTKTPLVTIPGNQVLINEQNALIPASAADLPALINRLYEDPALYQRLQDNGAQLAKESSAAAVAQKLAAIFQQVI